MKIDLYFAQKCLIYSEKNLYVFLSNLDFGIFNKALIKYLFFLYFEFFRKFNHVIY